MYSRFEIFIPDSDSEGEQVGPDLITLEALKLSLSISDDSDDDEDEALSAQITLWSEIIAEYLDRQLAFAHARETFVFELYEQTRPNAPLVLQLFPIIDIGSATVDGTEVEYSFDAANGLLFPAVGAAWSGTVVLEYTGGYMLPEEAPARLRAAITEAVRVSRQVASSFSGGVEGVREITHGDTHISFAQQTATSTSTTLSSGGLPVTVIDMLGPLKRRTV